MPILSPERIKLALLLNKSNSVKQCLLGIDLGTGMFGMSKANLELNKSSILRPKNSKNQKIKSRFHAIFWVRGNENQEGSGLFGSSVRTT